MNKKIQEQVLKEVFAGKPELFKERDRKFVERAIELTCKLMEEELKRRNYQYGQLANKYKQRDAEWKKAVNPLVILLERVDKGEYFNEDDKDLKWRESFRKLKELLKKMGVEK